MNGTEAAYVDAAQKLVKLACRAPRALGDACAFAAADPGLAVELIGTLVIVILHESTGGAWTMPPVPADGHLAVVDADDQPMSVEELSLVDRNIARMLSYMAAGDRRSVHTMATAAAAEPVDAARLLRRLAVFAHYAIHGEPGRRLVSVVVKDKP